MIDRELYRLHAKLPVYRRHVTNAINVVKEALAVPGIWAVSCSGGKDSMALIEICLMAGWKGPLFHFYYDETPGENTEMVQKAAQKYGLEFHLLKVPGAWEVYEKAGRFFVVPESAEEKRLMNGMLRNYKKNINEYIQSQGWAGQFMGLRKSESRPRRITLIKKGNLYRTGDRKTWTCCPLSAWDATIVWAFTFDRKLPYLSCYDKSENPERERSETTWLAAESIWRYGMAARLKKERSEEFNRLAARWPEIRYYV